MTQGQQLELARQLRDCASVIAAAEFEAADKHTGIMEGLQSIHKAVAFIEGYANGEYTEITGTRNGEQNTAPAQHH